ncbi:MULTISPECIES: hypothetical protein [unclassified Thermoplasma]|uniref:hypothetical protein n=1 Tax=unclassified Thermoplasma TaxID=2684908 RepID=UPI000D9EFC2B|nr:MULTISPECIES: hypothetical protein [unclassified Thermoplasma]PYB67760.1 hypothetical protein DMB44_07720 [Thermoplasma sp. Kam2015]
MSDNWVRTPEALILLTLVLWILNSVGYLKIPVGGGTYFNLGYTSGLVFLLIAMWFLFVLRGRSPGHHDPEN